MAWIGYNEWQEDDMDQSLFPQSKVTCPDAQREPNLVAPPTHDMLLVDDLSSDRTYLRRRASF
jgi:hypothetical protein